jgi:hypothetical protein
MKIKQEIESGLRKLKLAHIKANDIQYILTVPSIWNDQAKHLMNEWAINAGLVDASIQHQHQLRIVYEL